MSPTLFSWILCFRKSLLGNMWGSLYTIIPLLIYARNFRTQVLSFPISSLYKESESIYMSDDLHSQSERTLTLTLILRLLTYWGIKISFSCAHNCDNYFCLLFCLYYSGFCRTEPAYGDFCFVFASLVTLISNLDRV